MRIVVRTAVVLAQIMTQSAGKRNNGSIVDDINIDQLCISRWKAIYTIIRNGVRRISAYIYWSRAAISQHLVCLVETIQFIWLLTYIDRQCTASSTKGNDGVIGCGGTIDGFKTNIEHNVIKVEVECITKVFAHYTTFLRFILRRSIISWRNLDNPVAVIAIWAIFYFCRALCCFIVKSEIIAFALNALFYPFELNQHPFIEISVLVG